ncbi:MAG TPA: outer membrane lipoprotein carrier protein LolA, partial [Thermoleophilia bacterium]|nr:outer membrane lipoprotein carrier protein LolA [Thermoleophilia bacterium]
MVVHRRFLIIIAIVAVIAVAGATVGIIEARAQGESALATVTPAQLIASVSEHAREVASISGDVNWSNDILGLSMLSFGGRTPGDFTSLLSSGSGRVWVRDGRVRFEIQGGLGDTTIIGDSAKVWVYSSSKNTATEYALPAKQPGTTESTMLTPGTAIADPVAAIESYLRQLAPAATLTVDAPIKVAGRSCYVLSLTPTAPNTIFGSVRVAIDGETFIPLRIELLAKSVTEPV